jgi:hypothetical protein
MNFPITLNKIRAYEAELASQVEETIYLRIKPYTKIHVGQIVTDLKDQIQKNVRARIKSPVYGVIIGNYETLLRDFTLEDIEATLKKRFTDSLLRDYFPDAQVEFSDRNYTILLTWNTTHQETSGQTNSP